MNIIEENWRKVTMEIKGVTANPKIDRTDRTDPDRSEKPRTEKKPKPKKRKPYQNRKVWFGFGADQFKTEPNRTEPNRIMYIIANNVYTHTHTHIYISIK